MRLICSVTPHIYFGVIKYERKYKKSNEHTKILKNASKSSIMLGKLAIDFLAHYRSIVDGKYEGYQEQFYTPSTPDWEKLMNEYKEEWVNDIPLKDYNNANDLRNASIYKNKHLLDLCMKMREINDNQLESIEDDDEKMYWRMNVERFIDEATNMAYRLTMKMHEYIEKYGIMEIPHLSYNWNEEGEKWLEKKINEHCKEESI